MDSLTHVVIGAVTGDLIARKKIGKMAMLWGALANSLPDIDVVTNLWMNQPDSLLAHRGFTHSFLFCILSSLLFSWIFTRYYKNKSMLYSDWFKIFFSGSLIHILIDCMTVYGTGLLEPFSHKRFSFNTIFVADPFFTIWLLIPSIALLILKTQSDKRNFWVAFGLITASAYLCFTFYNKSKIDGQVKSILALNNIKTDKYFTTPSPLNNFLWYSVSLSNDSLYIMYRSIFDKNSNSEIQKITVNDSLLNGVRNNESVQKLIRFSQGYYTADMDSGNLFLNDARFGQVGGWYKNNTPFVFRFNLSKTEENDVIIQRGRMKASAGDAINGLVHRIFNEPPLNN